MVNGRLVMLSFGADEAPAEAFRVEDTKRFFVHAFARLGVSNEPGTQDQTFAITSPLWLCEHLPESSVMRGQALLLTPVFDAVALKDAIGRFVASCTGADARSVFSKMARLGISEREDYNERPLPRYFIDARHERLTPLDL